MSNYYDTRSSFFRDHFQRALSYTEYVATGTSVQQERWNRVKILISPTDSQKVLLQSFTRKIHILALSGIWCGDCSRQGALLNAITEHSTQLSLRFADNKIHKDLQDELRLNGAEKVPVFVFLSEDYFEMQRFGDRHLSVYRQKANSELGPSCELGSSAPSSHALAVEFQEWLDSVERIHLMLRLSPMLRQRYND